MDNYLDKLSVWDYIKFILKVKKEKKAKKRKDKAIGGK